MDLSSDRPLERDTASHFYRYENRIRFYMLVIALCGLSALIIELTSGQADRLESYARSQLEDGIGAEVQQLIRETK